VRPRRRIANDGDADRPFRKNCPRAVAKRLAAATAAEQRHDLVTPVTPVELRLTCLLLET
jgi:hypothetical protein